MTSTPTISEAPEVAGNDIGSEEDFLAATHEAIKKFNISNDEMGALITKVDIDGQKVEGGVAEWLKDNEARWKGWNSK